MILLGETPERKWGVSWERLGEPWHHRKVQLKCGRKGKKVGQKRVRLSCALGGFRKDVRESSGQSKLSEEALSLGDRRALVSLPRSITGWLGTAQGKCGLKYEYMAAGAPAQFGSLFTGHILMATTPTPS